MNNLNVFKYCVFSWKNPRHWINNIQQIFRGIKMMFQRAIKGYCEYDIWNLYKFYLKIFQNTLDEFTKDLHGAPDKYYDKETESIEKWVLLIKEIQQHFYNADEDNNVLINEYDNDDNILFNIKDGKLVKTDKWAKRQEEIEKYRQYELETGFNLLQENFWDLWD